MKAKSINNLSRFVLSPIAAITVGWMLVTPQGSQAQSRSTPGAGQNSGQGTTFPAAPNGQPGRPDAPAPTSAAAAAANGGTNNQGPQKEKAPTIGEYVALDDGIKNEMYGTIDFPNADLKDIIKAISKLANKNFILDRKIEGRKITILSPQPVTKQEAYNAFLSALYANELTIVSVGSFLKVIEAKNAIQSNVRVFVGDFAPNSEEIVTVIYPLHYLDAEEIQRFLTDLVPRNARITNYPNTNTLVMTDTGLNLRRVIAVLKSVDVPGYEDQLETIPIRFASAKGIATLIDSILTAQNSGGGRRTRPGNSVQKTRGGGVITKIVPDDRTNSIVVLANGRGVKEVRDLVSKLDTSAAAGGGNIHIYYCKNAVAEELASTINSLISGAAPKAGTNANPNGTPGQPPPPNPAPITSFNNGGGGNGGRGGGDGVSFEGQVKVTADKPTNSLVVIASGSDFSALKHILQRLDIAQRQVYVEATIMEISVSDSRETALGVNIAAPGLAQAGGFIPSQIQSGVPLASLVSTPAGVSGLVSTITAGQKVNVSLTPGATPIQLSTVTGLIHAIQDSSQGNIIEQPQILTSDNKEALIEIKNRVSVQSGSTTDTQGVVTNNTTKEDVTISLKITPQIGTDNNLIKLKVDQEIDDFSKAQFVPNNVDETTRKATTTVTVRDASTVVIGGLQKNDTKDATSKFPILGDIPILGWLFKGTSKQLSKSNLVLFLTPHVINSYSDLQKITSEKIDDRYNLGKAQYDPKDRLLPQVKNMRNKIRAESTGNDVSFGFKPNESDDKDHDGGDEIPKSQDSQPTTQPDDHPLKDDSNGGNSAFIQPNTPPPPEKQAMLNPDPSASLPPQPLIDQSQPNPDGLQQGGFLGDPQPSDKTINDSLSQDLEGNPVKGDSPAKAR